MARKVCTTIGDGRYMYAVAVLSDGTARVFQTLGETLWSTWYVDAAAKTNPRIPEHMRKRVEGIIEEQREILFGKVAA